MTRLRVTLDLTPLVGPPTGLARFVLGVLPRLVADDAVDVRGWVLSARGGPLHGSADELDVRRLRLPARLVHRAWAAGVPGAGRLPGGADVVHGTNFAVPAHCGNVLSVHDLTPLESTDLPRSLRGRSRLIRRAVDEGVQIVVPTEHVGRRLVDRLGADPARVTAVPYGLDPVPPADDVAGHRAAGTERYVLALGTTHRRKNLPALVAAMAALPADVGLVIAGPPGDDEPAVGRGLDAMSGRRPARRLTTVDEPTRAELLRGASVLAYPSLDEGFGFPPLEAMSVGVPVVASTAGSIPEVVGDGAVLVDPTDTEALAEAIGRVLDPVDAVDLVARGRVVAAGYDWATTAAGLTAVYRRAAGSR